MMSEEKKIKHFHSIWNINALSVIHSLNHAGIFVHFRIWSEEFGMMEQRSWIITSDGLDGYLVFLN
jgi:hypothetical protein